MGFEFEVEVWTFVGVHKEGESSINDYQWNSEYSGNDKEKAFTVLESCKANGCKCVRITWR